MQVRELLIQFVTQPGIVIDASGRQLQRVDHGVAGHQATALQTFAQQVVTRLFGRCEQQVGAEVDAAAVHFFRPRAVDVAGAQAGFHMADRDASMESGHRRDHGRSGIAVDQHPIRPGLFQHRVDGCVQRGSQGVERLVRRHHVEGEIGLEVEQIQDLLEHALMLAGDTDQ
nr:hypothetical protein GCM10020185_78050 [Pseudomonas brassicacearum subsp. brassicacearum]